MHKVKFNNINDRIVDEILKGKSDIKSQEKFIKETSEDLTFDSKKVIGNLTAMTFRKYISNILNYHNLKYKVSNINAFVKGCPIEWDLIILKNNANDINDTNVFDLDECVCLLEFKTSGLFLNQINNIEKTFEKQFNYLNEMRIKNKNIIFGYITFAESQKYYNITKEYFNKMNNFKNIDTTFAFLDYDILVKKDEKKYFEECNDFEQYLFNLLNNNSV